MAYIGCDLLEAGERDGLLSGQLQFVWIASRFLTGVEVGEAMIAVI